MSRINLAGVDLNLLVVFDALIDARHATRAAERVGLSQSAVSHALNRLRALFGDPLFVRSPRGMTPTPVALAAAPGVRSILDQIESVLSRERGFDPATSTRHFTIGLSDYAAFVLLPELTSRLASQAPGTSLIVRNTSHGTGLTMIDDGIVDLVAGNFPDPPPHLREQLLYEETFICAGRRDHPALGARFDLESYLALRHLQVSTSGEPFGIVDHALRAQSAARTIAFTVAHFLMAPLLVATSDLIATEPRRLFTPAAGRPELALVPPPIALPPFRVVQIWHARHDADPGHAWFRQQVAEVGARA